MTLATCTTNGIKVSVRSTYEANHSEPYKNKYLHSYTITIENKSDHAVRLLTRHWIIMDSRCRVKEVRGEGVIGQQPIIQPNESHTYSSWTPLPTDIGKMSGSYRMMRMEDNEMFDVRVPVFLLVYSARLN